MNQNLIIVEGNGNIIVSGTGEGSSVTIQQGEDAEVILGKLRELQTVQLDALLQKLDQLPDKIKKLLEEYQNGQNPMRNSGNIKRIQPKIKNCGAGSLSEEAIRKIEVAFVDNCLISTIFPEIKESSDTLCVHKISDVIEWETYFIYFEKEEKKKGVLARLSPNPSFEASKFRIVVPSGTSDFFLEPFPDLEMNSSPFFITGVVENQTEIKSLRDVILEKVQQNNVDYQWALNRIEEVLNQLNILQKRYLASTSQENSDTLSFYQKCLPDYWFHFLPVGPTDDNEIMIFGKECPPGSDTIDVVIEKTGPNYILRWKNEIFQYIGQGYEEIQEKALFQKRLKELSENHSSIKLAGSSSDNKFSTRGELLHNILNNPIESYNAGHKTKIPLPQDEKWRLFADPTLLESRLPLGPSLGDLILDKIFLFKDPQRIVWFDYQYVSQNLPILKDYASLEASIWCRIAAHVLPDLPAFSKLFLQLLVVGRISKFDILISDCLQQQLSNMVNIVRKEAFERYKNQKAVERWWRDYAILLYHELIINIARKGLKTNDEEVIMLYLCTQLMQLELEEMIM